jgi:hypothetical protein
VRSAAVAELRAAGSLSSAGRRTGCVNYAATMSVTSAQTMGWLRAAVGVALIAAPEVPLRLPGREDPTAASVLLMRTIGIRDLVLGLGTVAAARSDGRSDVRRWIAATSASDALDAAASLASFRSIGKRDAIGAALLALAFVGGDLVARRSGVVGSPAQ